MICMIWQHISKRHHIYATIILSHFLCNDCTHICNGIQALIFILLIWKVRIVTKNCVNSIHTDKEDKNKASYDCKDCETYTADYAVFNIEFIWIHGIFYGRTLLVTPHYFSHIICPI